MQCSPAPPVVGNGRAALVAADKSLVPREAQHRVLAAPSARVVRFHRPRIAEGAGKAGSSPLPWPACNKKARGRTTGSAETSRPSLRDGWTAYTRSPRGPALLPPSPRRSPSAKLGISTGMPGPHDFAGAPDRSSARKTHAAIQGAHRIPHPTSVTIAKRPLIRAGRRGVYIISEKKK